MPPYNILWPIVLTPTLTAKGWEMITTTHTITATAYDAAGNSTVSEEVRIDVAPEQPKKKTEVPPEQPVALWRPDDRPALI